MAPRSDSTTGSVEEARGTDNADDLSSQDAAGEPGKSAKAVSRRPGVGQGLRSFGIRFGVLYAALFVLARAAGVVPSPNAVADLYYRLKVQGVAWVGRTLLRLDTPIAHVPHGSGDQIFDWVLVGTLLALALLGAVLWMYVDRATRRERIAVELIHILLRYRLGIIMLNYGIVKIFYEQMPQPGMSRLLQPYGESSPMGLLWTFMGQSWAYSAFTGVVEFVGGLLLFFRRTTTLGALIVAAVMVNVLMMNFAFDVPVKLYSFHYLIFALALAAPDGRRLVDFLVLNRGTTPTVLTPVWPTGRMARLSPFVKVVVMGVILWHIPIQRSWRWIDAPRPSAVELHGLYEVERFARNGTERPPLTTDRLRWRRLAFDERGAVTVVLMDDTRLHFHFRNGPHAGQFMLEPVEGNYARGDIFTYSRADANRLTIKGTLNDGVVAIELRRSDPGKLLLRERRFRWINERPLNP